jgi:hypothetical protein
LRIELGIGRLIFYVLSNKNCAMKLLTLVKRERQKKCQCFEM